MGKIDDYRQRKESFVSDLNGTTLFETGSVMVTICSTYFLCQLIKSLCSLHVVSWRNFLLEYSFLIVPMLLVTTIFSSISHVFHWVFWLAALAMYSFLPTNKSIETRPSPSSFSRIIEIFRGQIFLVTCIGILAVDFHVFPRRYAKTENYGYSGMDLGVGLFAIAHGMVSSQARRKPTNWKEFVLENFVLLVLGIVRFLSMKSLSYVEHVSEYGVHWNFFLTLCLMKSIGNFFFYETKNLFLSILPFLLVAVLHQFVLLDYFRYENYLTSPSIPREKFIDANREGIFSLPGYVCLYLIGIVLGRRIIDMEQKRDFLSIALLLSPLVLLLVFLQGEASRKLCNLTYILSTSGLACLCLGGFSVIQWLLIRKGCSTESILLKNVNQKGLDVFLFANVFTGIVNLTIRTIDTSTPVALLILFFYTFIICAFGYFSPSLIKFVMKSLRLTK